MRRSRHFGGGRVVQGDFLNGPPRFDATVASAQPCPSNGGAQAKLHGAFWVNRPKAQAKPIEHLDASTRVTRLPEKLHLSLGKTSASRCLPLRIQRIMERALGHDFGNVRVHLSSEADALGARAFTVGEEVYFSPKEYQPGTPEGQRLIAHELTHVVQQRMGRVRHPDGQGLVIVQDDELEAEADAVAERIFGQACLRIGSSRDRPVQRDISVQRALAVTTVAVETANSFWNWTTDLGITVGGNALADDMGDAPTDDTGRGRICYLKGSTWTKGKWTGWKSPGSEKATHIERKILAALSGDIDAVPSDATAVVLDINQTNTPCSGLQGCATWFETQVNALLPAMNKKIVRLKSYTTYESQLLPAYPTSDKHRATHQASNNNITNNGYYLFHNLNPGWSPTPCSSCFG